MGIALGSSNDSKPSLPLDGIGAGLERCGRKTQALPGEMRVSATSPMWKPDTRASIDSGDEHSPSFGFICHGLRPIRFSSSCWALAGRRIRYRLLFQHCPSPRCLVGHTTTKTRRRLGSFSNGRRCNWWPSNTPVFLDVRLAYWRERAIFSDRMGSGEFTDTTRAR